MGANRYADQNFFIQLTFMGARGFYSVHRLWGLRVDPFLNGFIIFLICILVYLLFCKYVIIITVSNICNVMNIRTFCLTIPNKRLLSTTIYDWKEQTKYASKTRK